MVYLESNDEVQNEKISSLIDALKKIFLKKSTALSYVDCYSLCHAIVLQKHGENLYEKFKNIISPFLMTSFRPLVIKDLCKNRLDVFNRNLQDFHIALQNCRDILMFLETNYIKRVETLNVHDTGNELFRKLIMRNEFIVKALRNVIFGMIICERNGEAIDNSAIKITIDLLLYIGEPDNPFSEYGQVFEEEFLKNSHLYYKQEAQKLLKENNAVEYLRSTEIRLNEEKERVSRYLNKQTESKILIIVKDVLFGQNLANIVELDYGFNWMMQENRVIELKKIYELYKTYLSLDLFCILIDNCFNINANSIINHTDSVLKVVEKSKIIEDLINLQIKFNNLVKKCFENNEQLVLNVNNNFTNIMNSNESNSDYLACYIHGKMIAYERNAADIQIDNELSQFIELFKLVSEKDVFEKFYKSTLAIRLLSRRANLDIENKFIEKLQLECGYDYVKSIKNMTNDVVINNTQAEIFRDEVKLKDLNLHGIDMSLYVLNTALWPTFVQYPQVTLPYSMENVYKLNLKSYQDTHNQRKVTLQMNLGHVQIKAYYEGGVNGQNKKLQKRGYNLETSTLQAIVLMNFNSEKLSFNEIQAKTNIPETDLIKILDVLVKTNLLITINKENEESIAFYDVNENFFNKKRTINLKNPKEHQNQTINLKKEIDRDRSLEIEAAIVRIMKTRQTLEESNLQVETVNMLKHRFTPSIPLINKTISALIDREYIAYDPVKTKTLVYIS